MFCETIGRMRQSMVLRRLRQVGILPLLFESGYSYTIVEHSSVQFTKAKKCLGKWASVVRLLNVKSGEVLSLFELPQDEAAKW